MVLESKEMPTDALQQEILSVKKDILQELDVINVVLDDLDTNLDELVGQVVQDGQLQSIIDEIKTAYQNLNEIFETIFFKQQN